MESRRSAQLDAIGAPTRVAARVHALIPCYNRPDDLAALLGDLAASGGERVDITVVDNASEPPIELAAALSRRVRLVRSTENLGGAGGFNLAMREALASGAEYLWLLDADARLHADALGPLVSALEADASLVCVGSALAEARTGEIFETGGFVDRRTGEYVQPLGEGDVVACDYVAACSMLVRRGAVERAGLMPEVFINGDDVGFCLGLHRRTGGTVACVPASVARHPNPDKMRTWARYYTARNAFANIDALGLGGRVRFVRAIRETGRALCQTLVGRDDLAALHLAGLRDAADGRTTGAAPKGTIRFEPFTPWSKLPARYGKLEQREPKGGWTAVAGALWRLIAGARPEAAMASARARPQDWMAARRVVLASDEGFVVRDLARWDRLKQAAKTAWRGAGLAARLGAQGGRPPWIEPARRGPERLTLSILVLSYNRREALRRTLGSLAGREAEIIVVDNASTDATVEMVRTEFPQVRVLALEENIGVEAFNKGAAQAGGDVLLVLDDDATPGEGAIEGAMALLVKRADVGGVALHPKHPASGQSEWSFGEKLWRTLECPWMGCGNLVRRSAWEEVGGYEGGYFLYRNDTDLAMKLLDAGWKVAFDPAWVVWHDSPGAARKSLRWFELATRNWVWTMRRHGRGISGVVAIVVGWAWAHRLAGVSGAAHLRVIRGALRGLEQKPPITSRVCVRTGWAVRRMLRVRFG